MRFIPVSTQFLHAVKTNDASKVEEVILNSDSKKELITEYILENDKETLLSLLPHFKSKGLVLNIKTLLNV